ncbi:MAG: FecR domain-containing protein, partial [Cyanobacteria bacterium J06559_3]
MSRLYGNRYRCIGITGLLWGLVGAIVPLSVKADVPLIRADVESLQNNVEVILQGQTARPATLSDWLGLGDALRTSSSSRAELRFNDGSLARIGERATFRFSPNTRNFRLSNGTVLLLIPPGNGPSTIQTPSAVTGVQGTALVIRHIPFTDTGNPASPNSWEAGQPAADLDACNTTAQLMGVVSQGGRSPVGCVDGAGPINGSLQEYPGRTIVMVLTDNPQGPVVVTNSDGVTQDLTSGHMAVIEGDDIQVLEFDLSLFYQTSPLVEGLHLDDPSYEGSGLPTDPVRQETLDGLAAQDEFEGGYLLNPTVLSAQAQLSPTETWVVLPDQPSETGVQTARNSNKPIGLMSSLLVNRGVVNPNVAPAGVINPDGTSQANSSGGSTQTPSAKNPNDYSGSEPPQVGSNPPPTHSPGPTPGSTPTEPSPTPGDAPGNSGQTPTTPPGNSGSDPVTPPSEPPAEKPSPTPGNGAEPPTTDPGNAPGSSGGSPSVDPTPPGPVNDPDPVVEPTPDPTPNPDPVVEPTP